jgi:enamine deaminase RidA (YjgF/YER057c/UK114 family)
VRTLRSTSRLALLVVAASGLGCMAGASGGSPHGGGRMGPMVGGFGGEGTRYINPGTLAALDGFTHAVRVGLTIYISGEVPLDSMGHLVGPGDLKAQARQAFANLALVLKIAGARPTDVTKLNVYVVNFHPADFAAIREAAADFFPQRNPPAGIVLGVQSLPQEGMLIAVDAVANPLGMIPPKVSEDDRR